MVGWSDRGCLRGAEIMTYTELLEETAIKKREALAELNAALKGPAGFLVEAEIKKDPGNVAWFFLAMDFCKKLAEHIDEFMNEGEDVTLEVCQIYMAYEDGDENLYDYLPTEARLFDTE